MFKRLTGKPVIEWYPKAASTAFAIGDLVYFNGSGELIKADATSGDHAGVMMKDVASTDSDYASETMVPIDVPQDGDEFEVAVGTGTLTTEMLGNRYDLKDENEIDVSATAKKVVTVTRFISASKAVVKINSMIANANVVTS